MRKASPVPEAAGLASEIPVSAAQPESIEVCSSVNKASTESQPILPFLVFCITLALISCQNKQRGAQRVKVSALFAASEEMSFLTVVCNLRYPNSPQSQDPNKCPS